MVWTMTIITIFLVLLKRFAKKEETSQGGNTPTLIPYPHASYFVALHC